MFLCDVYLDVCFVCRRFPLLYHRVINWLAVAVAVAIRWPKRWSAVWVRFFPVPAAATTRPGMHACVRRHALKTQAAGAPTPSALFFFNRFYRLPHAHAQAHAPTHAHPHTSTRGTLTVLGRRWLQEDQEGEGSSVERKRKRNGESAAAAAAAAGADGDREGPEAEKGAGGGAGASQVRSNGKISKCTEESERRLK